VGQLIIFSINEGSFEKGFRVTLRIIKDSPSNSQEEIVGELQPNLEIPQYLKAFQQVYYCLERTRQVVPEKMMRIFVPGDQITHISVPEELRKPAKELENCLNQWLEDLTPPRLQQKLVHALSTSPSSQLVLQTQDRQILAKLPWHEWTLFKEFSPQSELILSTDCPKSGRKALGQRVKVLAILGHSEGINTQQDLKELQKLWGANVTSLRQPQRQELNNELWSQPWDILFFAGHSSSQGEEGVIYINDTESLRLSEVEHALRQSAKKGLKLAIFNSCDGLELVPILSKVGVPRIIVMRQPIPDRVAHHFLRYFLAAFSQGEPFSGAVQEARQKLQSHEGEFPCATWLPIICQKPNAVPLMWPQWAVWLNRGTIWTQKHTKSLNNFWGRTKKIIYKIFKRVKRWTIRRKIIFLVVGLVLLGLLMKGMIPHSTQKSAFLPVEICNNTPIFSCGNNPDLTYPADLTVSDIEEKISARKAFNASKYKEAINLFQKAWEKEKDPTTLISLNNAKIMQNLKDGVLNPKQVFTIAISNSFTRAPNDIGGSILFGVAWRQTELNNQNNSRFKLFIVMADDKNNRDKALEVAKAFIKEKQIIGVVGPYSSKVTRYVIDEYRKGEIVLISSTSTATIDAYKNEIKNNSKDYFSWFFRPISTTRTAAEALVKHLKINKINAVKIFYQDQDLFGKSFYKEFKDQIKKSNIKTIGADIQYIKSNSELIRSELINLKTKYAKEKIALAMITDAYTNSESVKKKLLLVEENNGKFFIAGSNTLYDYEILRLSNSSKLDKRTLENMVVSIPWHALVKDRKKLEDFLGFKINEKSTFWSINEPQLSWHMAMSYDAMQIFIEAISQQIKQGKEPTREGTRDVLASPTFKTEGLTGKIAFNGSDRADQFYSLIQPDCSTSPCGWREVERYTSR
jgi:ABC-type branched-subunit amino acid transport system substrate-binding protein